MAKLEELEEVDVSGNKLKAIPTTVTNCRRMHTVVAHSNCIEVFPEVMQLPEIKVCVWTPCFRLQVCKGNCLSLSHPRRLHRAWTSSAWRLSVLFAPSFLTTELHCRVSRGSTSPKQKTPNQGRGNCIPGPTPQQQCDLRLASQPPNSAHLSSGLVPCPPHVQLRDWIRCESSLKNLTLMRYTPRPSSPN